MVLRGSFISGNILSFLLLKDFKFLFMVLEIDVFKIPLNVLLKVNFLLNFFAKSGGCLSCLPFPYTPDLTYQ